MSTIQQFIVSLEQGTRNSLTNQVKQLLYIHMSCMIERMIKKRPFPTYEGLEEFEEEHKSFIRVVKNSVSVIEKTYSVEIPVEEIACIYDIVTMKQNTNPGDSEI